MSSQHKDRLYFKNGCDITLPLFTVNNYGFYRFCETSRDVITSHQNSGCLQSHTPYFFFIWELGPPLIMCRMRHITILLLPLLSSSIDALSDVNFRTRTLQNILKTEGSTLAIFQFPGISHLCFRLNMAPFSYNSLV